MHLIKILVLRTNNELAIYQAQFPHPRSGKEDSSESSSPNGNMLPPWCLNSEVASPLLIAYDTRIAHLERLVEQYKETLEELNESVKIVTHENEELHKKLKQTTDIVANRMASEKSSETLLFQNLEWQEMQERLDLYEKENDLYRQQQHEIEAEIERLREENKTLHNQSMNLLSLSLYIYIYIYISFL